MASRRTNIFAGLSLLAGIAVIFLISRSPTLRNELDMLTLRGNMKITSEAFASNGYIPSDYTCDGLNTSPQLTISGTPAGAQSLALIVDDPDAPAGTFIHWVVWNIPPQTIGLPQGGPVPFGSVEGKTSFGENSYGGPCPPSGTHRYFFKIFALDTTLDIPKQSDSLELERAMQGHVIDKAGLIGLYERQ